MKTLRRYIAAEVIAATALVTLALVMLFAFFDLVEQIKDLGRGTYRLKHVAIHVLLSVPNHVYELFPIAALIGTLFALAHLVANSEYTVMRASGMSAIRMSGMLVQVGLLFAAVTFVLGEFVGPPAEQLAHRMRSQAITGIVAQEFRSGLWVKDDRNFINVSQVGADSRLSGVRIYEFDSEFQLRMVSLAASGTYQGGRRWVLRDVVQTTFEGGRALVRRLPEADWQSVLEPSMLTVLQVKPDQMSAWSLYSYSQHLKENRQRAQRYEIAFWTKIAYPFAVLVMMVLALPFSQFQRREGGVGAKIFAGIMLGLAFHFTSRLFAHLGLLNDWAPLVSALAPTLLFLGVAVSMMWWSERR